MSAETGITIAPYAPGDEHAILACFKKVFNVERSLAHWYWKFRDCPYGLHCYLAKTPTGQVVSQFTCVPVLCRVGSATYVFSQALDSMVDPDFRKGLKKPGLFALTVLGYVNRYGHEHEEAVGFGLPNAQAYRIGRRLLGYSFLHDVVTLYKPHERLAADGAAGPAELEVARVSRFGPDADALWAAAAPFIEVGTIKDARYLDWRYADCPDVDYALLVARDRRGQARGLAVARGDYIGTRDAVLCDWVVPADDPEAGRALLVAVESEARRIGAAGLEVLFAQYAPEYRWLRDWGYEPRETQFIQVARSYTPKVPLERLRERWSYMLGDYDIV
ncbi:MAG: hypothetical protein JXQ29_14800 [Planctomycetes bacterium]|nr:hypothetical protein [Planctomycetota bacterium]